MNARRKPQKIGGAGKKTENENRKRKTENEKQKTRKHEK